MAELVSLSDLIDDIRILPIEFAKGSMSVTYRPSKITAAWSSKSQGSTPEAEIAVVRMICDLVTDWTVAGPLVDTEGTEIVAKGQKVPITPTIVSHLPGVILSGIADEINKDAARDMTRTKKG